MAARPGVLALDFDGTLAPFVVERMAATVAPPLIAPLRALTREPNTRMVIVSGRPVEELAALLPLDPLPELFGAHGWERRTADGGRSNHAPSPDALRALQQQHERALAAGVAAHLERKLASLALHWRGIAAAERATVDAVAADWERLDGDGFERRAFDGGVELRLRGRDKGDVMRDLCAAMPPQAPIAYAGDDDTDEDAFRALAEDGLGVLVAERSRPTAARVTLSPTQLLALLEAWLEATRRVGG